MKSLIGLNFMWFAITIVIVALMYNGNLKRKIQLIVGEVIVMALLSVGAWMLF